MKLFIKVNDKLVEATPEIEKDIHQNLYTEDGTLFRKGEKDELEKLTATVASLTSQVAENTEKTKRAETERDQALKEKAILEKASKEGKLSLPAFDRDHIEAGEAFDEIKAVVGPYDFAKQGQRLMDPKFHPGYRIGEKARIELVKFWLVVLAASKMNPDPAARDLFRKMYGDLPASLKTAIGDSGNNFPIPDIVEAEIMAFAREASVILQNARIWTMTSEKQSFPAESSSVTVSWGNTTPESNPGITEFELSAEELSAYSVVKNMTLADTVSDIISWITENMSEAAGMELDNKAFNGLGADSTFICSGILSSACGYSVVMGSHSTAFSQMDTTFLSSMIAKLDGLKKAGAKYWLNGAVIHFIRDLKDSNGRPIFYEGSIGSPTPPSIFGYPYGEVVKAPSTSAANTAFIAFGNLRYFGVGKREGATALVVDPYGLFTTNRTRFKLYQRWGLGMALAKAFVRGLTAAS